MIYSGSRRVNSEAAEHEYLSAPASLERPGDQETALKEKFEGEREGLGGKRGLGGEGSGAGIVTTLSLPHADTAPWPGLPPPPPQVLFSPAFKVFCVSSL